MSNLVVYLIFTLGILTAVFACANGLYVFFEHTKMTKKIATGLFLGACSWIFNIYCFTINGAPVLDLRFLIFFFIGFCFDYPTLLSFIPVYILGVCFSGFSPYFALLMCIVALVLKSVTISKPALPVIYFLGFVPIACAEIPIMGYLNEYDAKIYLIIGVFAAIFACALWAIVLVSVKRRTNVLIMYVMSCFRMAIARTQNIYTFKINRGMTEVSLSDKLAAGFEFDTTRMSFDMFSNILSVATGGFLKTINNRIDNVIYVTERTGKERYIEYMCRRTPFGSYKGFICDITDNISRYDLLNKLSEKDYVTGFPTYAVIKEELPLRAQESKCASYMLFDIEIDIERVRRSVFEIEFDILCYRYVSKLLADSFPDASFYSVRSGEIILVQETSSAYSELHEYAEKIRSIVNRSHKIGDRNVYLYVKVGACDTERLRLAAEGSVSDVFERLAYCRYCLENDPNNAIYVFSRAGFEEHKLKNKRKRYLSGIFDREEISVVYQPIVYGKDKSVFIYEVLLRASNDLYRNTLSFIEDCIEEGYCEQIDRLVIKKTIEDVKNGLVKNSVSINLFRSTGYIDGITELAEALRDIGEQLYLEFTEHLEDDQEEFKNKIIHARRDGIKTVLDDFGMGRNTIHTLLSGEFDVVKIPREIMLGAESSSEHAAAVESIAWLCRKIGAKCVVEGVEHEEEFEVLKGLSVEYFQGYYFGMPKSASNL